MKDIKKKLEMLKELGVSKFTGENFAVEFFPRYVDEAEVQGKVTKPISWDIPTREEIESSFDAANEKEDSHLLWQEREDV